VGCAGWTIRPEFAAQFGTAGSHLERYAAKFSAVEINSSFYRLHRTQTYLRWAESVPSDFRFSAKVPKHITHKLRLQDAREALDEFLATVAGLGAKLEVLLVQLPPSLQFDAPIAQSFFEYLAEMSPAAVVCEPRHSSWFTQQAAEQMVNQQVGLVQADPAPAGSNAFWESASPITYFRLHGNPRVYYSRYDTDFLQSLLPPLTSRPHSWCIFDNTAEGRATQNAMELNRLLNDLRKN
jgi:uncharacterized protein YecE (DUF72 family)